MADPTQRIAPITDADRTDAVRAMFAAIAGVGGSANVDNHFVLKTFARHPALTQPFLVFNRHLLSTSTLPVRLRQIAILRVAWVRRAKYMWASHMRMSLGLGLTVADIEAAKIGEASPHWADFERVVVRAADQLIAGSDVDDDLWASLTAGLADQQIMDLIFTIGAYTGLAMAFNAMRIQREPDLVALAEELGSPA
ncbi:carboxymuconolactone decarboxylase family protein [Sphingomonas naphthae]|uniref:Carboxymuconolactone decarboxylase family protein n=1 Tax=Sphingomonas naphthae TaxID=1813468 RepID=A0ABY7TSR1_9SPHN|nr:carboxymuconolactone decarboxylase family protein [Sphingomonas naphthae]WCT75269.1 carboxymuconolactone decarboxylase family protein [Sphingomonas naphthae]